MATLPSPKQPDAKDVRIRQLIDDGYVVCHNGHWLLTPKGWMTLSGAAERPIKPRKQSKDEILRELNQMITAWS